MKVRAKLINFANGCKFLDLQISVSEKKACISPQNVDLPTFFHEIRHLYKWISVGLGVGQRSNAG